MLSRFVTKVVAITLPEGETTDEGFLEATALTWIVESTVSLGESLPEY